MKNLIFLFVYVFFLTGISLSQIKIGVAIPLRSYSASSEEKKMGEVMLKGINDALNEYMSKDPGLEVKIKAEDTKKDASETLEIFNEFGSDPNFIAILGPVYSSELANNVGAAEFHKIPVITPTATQNGLAEKNDFIYQLNPTYCVRGSVMAKFAMNELGMKNFLILSDDSYGKNFYECFKSEVENNNGKIIFTKLYSKDDNDLTEELSELKSKLLEKEKFINFGNLNKEQQDKLRRMKFLFSYYDSLLSAKSIVSIYKLFGKSGDSAVSSAGLSTVTFGSNAPLDLIYGYADGVYMPISNFGEISKVAAQYFSERINLPILGTSDWNNPKKLDENRMYIKELFFESDFYLDVNNKPELNETDLKNYYFGYDAMKFILDKISEGNNTREKLKEALDKTADYISNHNNITIKSRTNNTVSIMVFRSGELTKLMNYVY